MVTKTPHLDFEPVVYVADAGSVSKGNHHWACSRSLGVSRRDPSELADQIVEDLSNGKKVALGYESPLFLPCPEDASQLGKARRGECTLETGNRPWSASAGATVLATGMQSLAWILRRIGITRPSTTATTDWQAFISQNAELFVWEAFVSGSEKASPPSHEGDARLAIESFLAAMYQEGGPTSAIADEAVFSMVGAAILHAGLSTDLRLLSAPALVLRPLRKL